MNWIWVASAIQWVMIFALSLVLLALMRHSGELANRIDGVKGLDDDENVAKPEESEAEGAVKQPAKVDVFIPFSELPEYSVPLIAGGTFQLGWRQPAPYLMVFFSPVSAESGLLLEAIREFVKRLPPEFAFLIVMDVEHSSAWKYVADKLPESVSIAILEDFPEQLRPEKIPLAVAIAGDGKVAARGRPKSLMHLVEMAFAAQNMADTCPPHSRRQHEWGESAPYWAPGQTTAGSRHNGFELNGSAGPR